MFKRLRKRYRSNPVGLAALAVTIIAATISAVSGNLPLTGLMLIILALNLAGTYKK
jgi:hypothetical protein